MKTFVSRFSALVLPLSVVLPISAQTQNAAKAQQDVSKESMAATAHPLATAAATEMFRKGGNAIDAAVAAAFAIGVVEPDGSGLGGGGGMVIYLSREGRAVYINYYPKASEKINRVSFDPKSEGRTGKAVLVPGTVAGLTAALEKYGRLPLATVLEPAIRYADQGFKVDEPLARTVLLSSDILKKHPSTASMFLPKGEPVSQGDILRQPDLAKVLRSIAARGRDGFYDGAVARTIVNDVTNDGGTLTLQDMKSCKARIGVPLRGSYRGYDVLAASAPQSGASVIEALNILENENLRAMGHFQDSAESLHLMAETFRRVYADRSAFLGDPAFANVPLSGLTSKQYAKARYNSIDRAFAVPREYRKTPVGDPFIYNGVNSPAEPDTADDPSGEGGHTTHISVADSEGNAVSLTQTLGSFFGCGMMSSGVLLNQSRTNFSTRLRLNIAEPAKQPRSTISPAILLKEGKPVLVVGSPGASRIIATVVELIVDVIDYGMSAGDANDAPRFLCQKNDDCLSIESRIPEDVRAGLKAKGHQLKIYDDFDFYFGGAQIIVIDPATHTCYGSSDPRRAAGSGD